MKMESFLNGVSKDISSLAETNAFNLHFNDFNLIRFDSPHKEIYKNLIEKHPEKKEQLELEACKHNEEWYLMGVDFQKDQEIACKFSNPKILISLINLASKIVSGNGLVNENGQTDELSFCEDIKEWCKTYGLPYYEGYFMKQYYEKNGIGGIHAFRLWEFKRRIALLSDYFNLWHGLVDDDMRKIIEYSKRVHPIDLNKDIDSQIPFLKESLADTIWGDIKTEISIRYNKEKDTYEIVPHASSLLAVAYFQFAMLMTNNGVKGVKFCTQCHKLFEIKHGSTKICGDCKREYHRIKTQESRKRRPNPKSNF
jgi:hypothetical protein